MMDRRDFLLGSLAGAAGLGLPLPAEPARKFRYGVVGAGNRSRNGHLPILKKYFPDVEIAALCDITPEALQQGLALCGPATVGYNDYRRMLAERSELDAVVVIVPNYLHAEVSLAALQSGKHVLVEKPMTIRLADADRMIQAARQRQLALLVGQQSRYASAFQRMAELIRQGAIGDLEFVFGSLFRGDWNPRSWRYTDPQTNQQTNWRFLTATAGSSLLEDGIHELDVIHWLVGARPRRVQAQGGNNVYKNRETIDHAALLIEFSNGVKCTFAFTLFTPGVPNPRLMRLLGSQGEMELEREGRGQNIVIRRYRGQPERIPVPYLTPEEQSFWPGDRGDLDIQTVRAHRAFLQSMTSGAQPFADGQVGRDAIHISLAAERSLRTGRALGWEEENEL